MLVSHRKRFVYTKTVKTAGTSVESFFEPHCMADGEWQRTHARPEYVSESGIIGYRGNDARGARWWNHMPAARIREQLGRDAWDSYFKFCVVRNPYEKLVSGFEMFEKRKTGLSAAQKARIGLKRLLGRGDPIHSVQGSGPVQRFRSWIRLGGWIDDRDKYLIDGVECMDFYIRHEALLEGLRDVCERIGVEFDPSRLPSFKRADELARLPIAEYFDSATVAIVQERYRFEIERFGYRLPA